jgi:hypothetical protein
MFGVRRTGRRGRRWLQGMKDDPRRMRIDKRKEKAQERYTWLLIVKKPKRTKGCRAEKEEESIRQYSDIGCSCTELDKF